MNPAGIHPGQPDNLTSRMSWRDRRREAALHINAAAADEEFKRLTQEIDQDD